jgi:LAGLIDADG endonuclease
MEKTLLKNNWISWFIGFCDAEANFQTFPKKRNYATLNGQISNYYNIGYGFHLSLSIKDRELLLQIHKNLNYLGKIYEYNNNRQEIRLAITKLDDLKWLIENIFEISPLLTKHQRDRYNRLKYGVITKFNRVETKEEYEEFINNTKPISGNHSLDSIPQPFLDNWMAPPFWFYKWRRFFFYS